MIKENKIQNPRDLNEEEIKKYGLFYYNGMVAKPAIETSTVIWATAVKKEDPIYRLYSKGTNCLCVLRYNWEDDKWEEIEYTEINNLYGLLWLMCLELQSKNK